MPVRIASRISRHVAAARRPRLSASLFSPLLCPLLALSLAGCSREAPPPPPASAAGAKPAPASVSAAAPAPSVAGAEASAFGDVPREAPAAPDAEQAALMKAVFGDGYQAKDKVAVVDVPEAQEDMGTARIRFGFASRAVLPDGRIALVVNGEPASADGESQAGHASPGLVGVYLLRREGAQLQVAERHPSAGSAGSHGFIGEVRWALLGPGRPGIVLYSGGTWQGYSVTGVDIFDLADKVRNLGGFQQHSDSEGACGPGVEHCWNVHGDLRFDPAATASPYRDIVVDFTGEHAYQPDAQRYADEDTEPPRKIKPVKQRARYRFDGKAYGLVEGENPVPGV